MRKRICLVFIAVLVAGWAPAVAAEPSAGPAGGEPQLASFLAALAVASPCTIQQTCTNGSVLSCTGTTCSGGPGSCGGWITCDGVTHDCPVGTEWAYFSIGCCGSGKNAKIKKERYYRTCGGPWQDTGAYICENYCILEP